ncbi:MAG: NTP transferase domain-containing protein [Mogibacterium sp.]|nr:NTP transferase domain-containing protein [Mogibacterium sp.]
MTGNWGCVLLAGGSGKRFGYRNKALLEYNDETFAARIIREMEGTGLPCFLSAAAYEQEVPAGWTLVKDETCDEHGHYIGPMGGLLACLKVAKEMGLDGLFLSPCDAPLYSAELAEKLSCYIDDEHDAVIWQSQSGRLQTTFGYYAVTCIPVLEQEIGQGLYKMQKFLEKIRTRIVPTEEAGIDDQLFMNINSAEEYAALLGKAAERAELERQERIAARIRKQPAEALPLEQAVQFLKDNVRKIAETEVVSTRQARGRILAEDLIAPHDQPPFPRSPFDGYAIRSEDSKGASKETPVTLRVLGEVDAGGWFEGEVHEGECVRIMTGAPIPKGADAVIKQEESDYGEETVQIYRQMRKDQNYIFPGEDYRKGSVLLEEGEHLGPSEVGMLASAGRTEAKVFRKPRAAVLSTGDEIRMPGEPLAPGKIYDSNVFTLTAQLEDWGVEVLAMLQSKDDPEVCISKIREWKDKVDFIVTTGGVSVGKKDIMHEVFDMMGIDRVFWKVGIKPGAAMMAGKYGDTLVLSLSGNPYASFVDLHMLVRPVVAEMTGNDSLEMIRQAAELVGDYTRESPIRRFIRCYVQDGKAYIDGHTGGNGDVSSSRHMNAMIDVPAGTGKLRTGDAVTVILL